MCVVNTSVGHRNEEVTRRNMEIDKITSLCMHIGWLPTKYATNKLHVVFLLRRSVCEFAYTEYLEFKQIGKSV